MTTRRSIVKAGAGLAAIIAAGKAPAALVRSMLGMRNAMMAGKKASGGYWGLCFTAEQAGSTVTLARIGTPPDVSLETSLDGQTWVSYTVGDTITLTNAGDKVYFAAGPGGNTSFVSSVYNYHNFVMSGLVAASGSIMSMLDRDVSLDVIHSRFCYTYLFKDCASLTTAPELPATTLQQSCYLGLFENCIALTEAPELPATDMKRHCYDNLFRGCSNLATVSTRQSSFLGCSSWVENVASTGMFTCPAVLGTDETITRGVSACPAGWSVSNLPDAT